MRNEFYLTTKLPSYIFSAIYELKTKAKNNGVEIIDFGMGNPDLPPPQHVMERMSELAKNPKLFGYSVVGGIDDLKKANCKYYKRRFGVELNYQTQTLVTIGAKEGIASLATAISDEESYVIVPSPYYPIHTFAFEIAKSNVVHVPAINGYDFLEKFKEFVKNAKKLPLAVIVCFPSNPTTETVGLDFYQELVDFCKEKKIYIISDLAYCELYFDEKNKPHSILEIDGAKDVAIEFSSVSKTYSMAGCRVGFASGNENLLKALHKIKSYLDYGSFEPLQISAVDALSDKTLPYLENLRATYKKRAEFLVEQFNKELNWNLEMPKAGMFCWTKLPEKFAHFSSFDFCKKLIEETGIVFSPGSSFGKNGEGYIRISLIHENENVVKAVQKLKTFFDEF